jgi:hypothetical protein
MGYDIGASSIEQLEYIVQLYSTLSINHFSGLLIPYPAFLFSVTVYVINLKVIPVKYNCSG